MFLLLCTEGDRIFQHILSFFSLSGEPCFQGWPIPYSTNPYAFTLTTAGLCPKTLHLDLVIPLPEGIRSRSSQQSVLEARTLPLSYRGRADASCLFIGYLSKGYVLVFLLPNPGSLAQGLSLGAAAKENRLPKWSPRPALQEGGERGTNCDAALNAAAFAVICAPAPGTVVSPVNALLKLMLQLLLLLLLLLWLPPFIRIFFSILSNIIFS